MDVKLEKAKYISSISSSRQQSVAIWIFFFNQITSLKN
jgi:hypothetical protein